MTRKRVVVLMGGVSSEHDVSLKSGAMVADGLDPALFEVVRVVIGRNGCWRFGGGPPLPIEDALKHLCSVRPDCVFIALHGPFGEDGRIQGVLDLLQIPYTGSGCIPSGVAMDKLRCKAVVRQAGVRVARDKSITAQSWSEPARVLEELEAELGLPCVVKSPCQGSSLGMAICETREELLVNVPPLFELDDVLMAEEYLAGREFTCSVLDVESGQPPRPLPVTEIRPLASKYFDYYAKYTPGACEEITPAELDEPLTQAIQDMASAVHCAVGCSGLSRSDMIVVDGAPVWLEVNTIPGMTQTSLFPQAAAAVGIEFRTLVGLLADSARIHRKSM